MRLSAVYQVEHFQFLERALHDANVSKRRFDTGQSPAHAAYWAVVSTLGIPLQHQQKIEQWRKAVPDSAFVHFAQAGLAYQQAWRVRGQGYGGTISNESWDLFEIRLAEAEKILMDAPAELRETPIWHHLLLVIVSDSPRLSKNAEPIFKEAVRRWPDYYDFYEAMIQRMVPRWGGSWEVVDSFISTWSKERAATEGSSLYARFYSLLPLLGYSPRETLMHWPKMKASLEDLIARYPAAKFKNRYASLACVMKDKPAFDRAMSQLTAQQLAQDQWMEGHSYEACMRWAAV
jgi:hypothetical protein